MGRPRLTLIELLVVLAVVALLLSIVAPRSIDHVDRARETTLRATLREMRSALDQFDADRGRPPATLQELVGAGYLRELPVDPITERRDTWIVVGPSETRSRRESPATADARTDALDGVADVHSGAETSGKDGTPFREW